MRSVTVMRVAVQLRRVEPFTGGAFGVRLQREVQEPERLREQQQRDGGAADQHGPGANSDAI